MNNFTHIYQTYKYSMVRITIVTEKGDLRTGSAFHIGDGWLATAAHVVNKGKVEEAVSEYCDTAIDIQDILYHDDEKIDLAILKTNLDLEHYLTKAKIIGAPKGFKKTDHLLIGGHLDDWVSDTLVLTKVLLMGYPPIPFSKDPVLLASEGEVNAIVDKYTGPHPHFVISNMGRGGYSGGPVISEFGFLLGVLTESLVENHSSEEVGHTSAISVEPLLTLLYSNGIYPGGNKETIENLLGKTK